VLQGRGLGMRWRRGWNWMVVEDAGAGVDLEMCLYGG